MNPAAVLASTATNWGTRRNSARRWSASSVGARVIAVMFATRCSLNAPQQQRQPRRPPPPPLPLPLLLLPLLLLPPPPRSHPAGAVAARTSRRPRRSAAGAMVRTRPRTAVVVVPLSLAPAPAQPPPTANARPPSRPPPLPPGDMMMRERIACIRSNISSSLDHASSPIPYAAAVENYVFFTGQFSRDAVLCWQLTYWATVFGAPPSLCGVPG